MWETAIEVTIIILTSVYLSYLLITNMVETYVKRLREDIDEMKENTDKDIKIFRNDIDIIESGLHSRVTTISNDIANDIRELKEPTPIGVRIKYSDENAKLDIDPSGYIRLYSLKDYTIDPGSKVIIETGIGIVLYGNCTSEFITIDKLLNQNVTGSSLIEQSEDNIKIVMWKNAEIKTGENNKAIGFPRRQAIIKAGDCIGYFKIDKPNIKLYNISIP